VKTILALTISLLITGCAGVGYDGFVYNSPGHPNPITLYRVARTLPPVGFMCDTQSANCKPAYTYPTGMRLGPNSVTPQQAEAGVLGFWCNERAADCRPVYAAPATVQTTTMGFGIIQVTPVCAQNGCLPYSAGFRYGY
jgi:hypothetical protein